MGGPGFRSCSILRRELAALEARQAPALPDGERSATESAALLDVCQRLELLDEAGHRAAKGTLVRVVSMLIKLTQSCEE